MTSEQLIAQLGLQPLQPEGGYFVETYRSLTIVSAGAGGERPASTAIYYLLTDATCSRMHRLRQDELWHFYLGDPVEMLQLAGEGQGRVITLGQDLAAGQTWQVVVAAGVWQGACLSHGGRWALLGCTVAPGFDFADFEAGERERLVQDYPAFRPWIEALT